MPRETHEKKLHTMVCYMLRHLAWRALETLMHLGWFQTHWDRNKEERGTRRKGKYRKYVCEAVGVTGVGGWRGWAGNLQAGSVRSKELVSRHLDCPFLT